MGLETRRPPWSTINVVAVRVPPFLTRLTVQNYRSLRDVDLHLQPLNVLVGPNGAGKSNLLDVIDFLGESVRMDLAPALDRKSVV